MMNKKKNFLKVSLQSFSASSLNRAIKSIKEYVKSNFGIVIGPILIPVRHRKFSIRRSPHIYGGSRENISLSASKRVLYITFDDPEKNINLDSFITADVSVRVDFKELAYKRPDVKKKKILLSQERQEKVSGQNYFPEVKPLKTKSKPSRGTV